MNINDAFNETFYGVTEILKQQEFTDQLSLSKDEEILYFVGPTGAGKSTEINYLSGTRYDAERSSIATKLVVREGSLQERAVRGNNLVRSETLFPELFKVQGKDYSFCDLSGFLDSRGAEESIAGDLMADAILKQSKKTKGIVFTIDVPSILTARAAQLRENLLTLDKVLGGFSEAMLSNVIFTLTKVSEEDDVSVKDLFIQEYMEPIQNELLNDQNSGDIKNNGRILLNYVNYFIAHKNQIFIADVTDNGESYRQIMDHIDGLHAVDSSRMSFVRHSEKTIDFMSSFQELREDFKKEIDWLCEYPSVIAEERDRLDALEDDLFLEEEKTRQEIQSVNSEMKINENELSEVDLNLKNLYQEDQGNVTMRGVLESSINKTTEELSTLRKSNKALPIHEELLQRNGETELVSEKYCKKRAFRKCIISGWRNVPRAKQGNGNYVFDVLTDLGIHSVTLNGQPHPYEVYRDDAGRRHVKYVHHYPFAHGTNVRFTVNVNEKDHPDTRRKIEVLEQEISAWRVQLTEVNDAIDALNPAIKDYEEQKKSLQDEAQNITKALVHLEHQLGEIHLSQEGLEAEVIRFNEAKEANITRAEVLTDQINQNQDLLEQGCVLTKLSADTSADDAYMRYFDSKCGFFGLEKACEINQHCNSNDVDQGLFSGEWMRGVDAFDANAFVQQYDYLDTWLDAVNAVDFHNVGVADNANMLGAVGNLALIGVLVSAMYSLYQSMQQLWVNQADADEAHFEVRLA